MKDAIDGFLKNPTEQSVCVVGLFVLAGLVLWISHKGQGDRISYLDDMPATSEPTQSADSDTGISFIENPLRRFGDFVGETLKLR